MNKTDQGYTVVLVPDDNGNISRLYLSPVRLRRLVWAGIGVLAILVSAVGYSVYTIASLPERWRMEAQMEAQQIHMAALTTRLEKAESTMDRVQRLDRKLRVILGEPVDNDERTVLGVGGPSSNDLAQFDAVLDRESRMELARLDVKVEQADNLAKLQEMRLYDLDALMADQEARLDSTPSIWPTKGWVTSTFGMRTSPFTGSRKMHEGIDIATRMGNPVVAAADGVVLFAGVKSGYGKLITVDHGYGLTSRYGHLSRIDVKAGDLVGRGDRIGGVGNTGRSTGPHLHYEVHMAGVPVNPFRYILLDDQQLQ